ncbi:hypothetical protein [Colwellia sp. UCD-KL20]|uniref:hypothetical protein n=1 Tax=Colwellia sp. UCD-KL20 TaxID=1917165 RepID=UPI000970F221|nr:hypothetical protein [Colwellia sp. UCD-KL20]
MKNKINAVILLLIIEIFTLSTVHAAFCSLRDPISAIQMIYEQGYQFRSVVTTVTEEDRQSIKQQLPFTIHQSEVGKHTLYVLYKNDKHAGFLQARSEWAKWGLVEIAWAINVDRSIKGFYFQRCRSPECNDNTQQGINAVLKNKTLPQLKRLLSTNGETLSPEGQKAFAIAPQLALLTLRSALKTLVITDISWKKDIEQIAAVNY